MIFLSFCGASQALPPGSAPAEAADAYVEVPKGFRLAHCYRHKYRVHFVDGLPQVKPEP